MTEPDAVLAPEVKAGPTKPVTFKDRVIATVEPTEEQFVAMLRLTKLPRSADGMSAHRMVSTINRVPDLVRALCASEEDAEWFEDGLVNGKLKVLDLPEFIGEVMVTWWAEKGDNRAAKRVAKKAGARLAR